MQQDNQRDINKLCWLFCTVLGVYFIVMMVVTILEQMGIDMSNSTNLLLVVSELTIAAPGIVYVIVNKLEWKSDLGFNRIKIVTVLLSIVLGFLVMPIASFVNILSQFFVPNTMVQASDELLSGGGASDLFVLLVSGIVAPFIEEFVFRGILSTGFTKYGTPVKAMFLSGLFFGLMHLNLNQLCYAFVLGLIFYIANRASGSVYTSVIMHIVINSVNMLMLYAMKFAMGQIESEETLAEASEAVRNSSSSMIAITIEYGFLAVIFGAMVFGVIILIASVEGRKAALKEIFVRQKEADPDQPKTRLFLNAPAIIGVVFSLFIMFGIDKIIQMFS